MSGEEDVVAKLTCCLKTLIYVSQQSNEQDEVAFHAEDQRMREESDDTFQDVEIGSDNDASKFLAGVYFDTDAIATANLSQRNKSVFLFIFLSLLFLFSCSISLRCFFQSHSG